MEEHLFESYLNQAVLVGFEILTVVMMMMKNAIC
jgi:hypothetical protein